MLISPLEGRWAVRTKTSAYVLDLDEMTCARYPGMGVGTDDPDFLVVARRKDDVAVPLLALEQLELHESMIMYLDIRQDGVVTMRSTTPVMSCERIVEP